MQWHALGNSLFRRWTPFDMTPWRERGVSDLKDFIVAAAPFAGPIALLPRVSNAQTDTERRLTIFTASGERLAEIPWQPYDAMAPLVQLSWTDAMRLVAVLANGRCVSFTPKGDIAIALFSILPLTMEQDEIVRCESWSGGVVVLTDKMAIIQVAVPVAGPPKSCVVSKNAVSPSDALTCMAVVEPRGVESAHPEILIATADNMVRALSFGYQRVFMHEPLDAPIALIAAPSAASSSLIAIFTEDGVLTILDTSCDSKTLVFHTQSKTPPLAMCWCGDDAVALYWPSAGVVLVGLSASWLRFPMSQSGEEECVLVQEIDCCRLYGATGHDVFIRVPPSMERAKRTNEEPVTGTGAIAIAANADGAAAMLLRSKAAMDAGDHEVSDALCRTLKRQGTLQVAIDDCIDARRTCI
ncbi:hypothetical protein PINS_up012112 [Pythium insidiosum]|nr:hypothetical protein PINS_up012112 [Pythium insidiosum]